jgi:hypothetical protein
VIAGPDSLLYRGKHIRHKLNLSFVRIDTCLERMSRMVVVDCHRISHASARKCVPSCATCRFSERMSQVAITGVRRARTMSLLSQAPSQEPVGAVSVETEHIKSRNVDKRISLLRNPCTPVQCRNFFVHHFLGGKILLARTRFYLLGWERA